MKVIGESTLEVVGMQLRPCVSVPTTKLTIKVKAESALEKHIVNVSLLFKLTANQP